MTKRQACCSKKSLLEEPGHLKKLCACSTGIVIDRERESESAVLISCKYHCVFNQFSVLIFLKTLPFSSLCPSRFEKEVISKAIIELD